MNGVHLDKFQVIVYAETVFSFCHILFGLNLSNTLSGVRS